ncbi:MAG TPA: hypothetical protein VII00_03575 [bacterium]
MPEKGEKKGDLPPEVDKYLAALIKDPKSKAFVPLADAYRKAGMIDEAVKVALDGLKYNSNYVSGRLILSKCYFEKNMFKETGEEIRRVIKANPENIDAQKILAQILEHDGNVSESQKVWGIVLTLNPNDPDAKAKIKPSVSEKSAEVHKPVAEQAEKAEGRPAPDLKAEIKATLPAADMVKKAEPAPARQIKEEVLPSAPKAEKTSEIKAAEEPPHSGEKAAPNPILESHQSMQVGQAHSSQTVTERPPELPKISKDTDAPKVNQTYDKKGGHPEQQTVSSLKSLADLYVQQGYLDRALKVYSELLESHSDDAGIKDRIKFIQSQMSTAQKTGTDVTQIKVTENIKTLSAWLDKIKKGG